MKELWTEKYRTYDPEICKKIVEPLIPKIEEKFSKFLILDYRKIYTFDDQINNQKSMPRVSLLSSFIPCSSFYYVNFLTEQQPEEIIDLGCGPNFFKNIFA